MTVIDPPELHAGPRSAGRPRLQSALAMAAWLLWSVLVVRLPEAGFRFSVNQLFWLVALPGLSGATLRLVGACALPLRGGRRWTLLSTAALLLPTLGLALALRDPSTRYELMVLLALLCGLGGSTVDDRPEDRAAFAEQAVIFRRRHNWLLAWLMLGSLGSLIGHAAALPLLAHTQFPDTEWLPLAGLGPLLGAMLGPLGAHLADRHGAARVAFWSFAALGLAPLLLLQGLPQAGHAGRLAPFVAGALLALAAAGLGTGAVVRMVAVVFVGRAREAAAVLGFAVAVAGYGGFFVPKSLGSAIALTGSPAAAFGAFALCTLSCIAVTWWHYGRRFAPMPC